jgi:hypothetical protein
MYFLLKILIELFLKSIIKKSIFFNKSAQIQFYCLIYNIKNYNLKELY